MSSNIFKISAVAATIAASFGAQAALYDIYPYQPLVATSSTYGVAIQDNSSVDCWSTSCAVSHSSDDQIGVEEQRFAQGFQYRNEAPFLLENGFEYLEDGLTGFESYCYAYLDYSDAICDQWAKTQYTDGYLNEVNGDFANSTAFVEVTKVNVSANNTIINSISDLGVVNGTYQVDDAERTVAFFADDSVKLNHSGVRSRGWKQLDGATVGSVSFAGTNSNDYKSQAVIWDTSNAETLLGTLRGEDSRNMPQSSARDITRLTSDSNYYAVGYIANSDLIPTAAIFPIGTNLATISAGTPVTVFADNNDYDDAYINSLLTSVNENGIAIGTAKNRNNDDGAVANVLFYVPDVTNPSVVEFRSKFSSMFFRSANTIGGAINNNDEVVGQVDYERHQEANNGKPRARRAFIAQLDQANAKAPIGSSPQYLDDLTYGGSDLNEYRIIDATDINDAGVIAGTAYYCAGGYATEAIDASCSGDLSVVAVKLVPRDTDASITKRPVIEETIERQGASLGFLALTLLGFLGFRRK